VPPKIKFSSYSRPLRQGRDAPRALEVGAQKIGLAQQRPAEVRAGQIGAGEQGSPEVRAAQVGLPSGQIDIWIRSVSS